MLWEYPVARCCVRPSRSFRWGGRRQAIRHIAYSVAKVPSRGDVRKDAPLPDEDSHTILYLDNFDEIRYLKREIAEASEGVTSPNHEKFIDSCESLGLPRNLGKQLSGSLRGTLQGGEIIRDRRILRDSYEKSVELLDLSLGLVPMDGITEFCVRHWTGKAAFAAAFRRPLYSILQEVYALFEWVKDAKRVELPPPVVDMVLCFASLLPFAETDLGSPIIS